MGPNEQNQHFAELRHKVCLYIHAVVLLRGLPSLNGKNELFVGKRWKSCYKSDRLWYYNCYAFQLYIEIIESSYCTHHPFLVLGEQYEVTGRSSTSADFGLVGIKAACEEDTLHYRCSTVYSDSVCAVQAFDFCTSPSDVCQCPVVQTVQHP